MFWQPPPYLLSDPQYMDARQRSKDQLKRELAQVGISHQSWQQEASDRDSWRSSVRKASCEFEAERHKATKEKCRRQKERAASLPSSSQTFVCPKCGMGCASRIGLYGHQRACKNWPSTFPTILVCEEWAIIIHVMKTTIAESYSDMRRVTQQTFCIL